MWTFCRSVKSPLLTSYCCLLHLDTPSSVSSLVPQKTIFPTSSIRSATTVVKPSSAIKPTATTTTRTVVSTVVTQNVTGSSRTFSVKDLGSSNTKRLSTLVIVVIAVSVTAVAVGLIASCYIWRRRNSERFLSFFSAF